MGYDIDAIQYYLAINFSLFTNKFKINLFEYFSIKYFILIVVK